MEFALEPEAAAVYVKETKVAKQKVSDDEHALVPFPVGTRFMVLDLGGWLVNFKVQKLFSVKPHDDRFYKLYLYNMNV